MPKVPKVSKVPKIKDAGHFIKKKEFRFQDTAKLILLVSMFNISVSCLPSEAWKAKGGHLKPLKYQTTRQHRHQWIRWNISGQTATPGYQ